MEIVVIKIFIPEYSVPKYYPESTQCIPVSDISEKTASVCKDGFVVTSVVVVDNNMHRIEICIGLLKYPTFNWL